MQIYKINIVIALPQIRHKSITSKVDLYTILYFKFPYYITLKDICIAGYIEVMCHKFQTVYMFCLSPIHFFFFFNCISH